MEKECVVNKLNKLNNDKLKKDLIEVLEDFFGMNTPDGTYAHWLTRCKSAYSVGTITLDDFEKFTEETVNDIADEIVKKIGWK
jgi:hypothetical protein